MLQPLQLTVRQCCDFLPAIHLISLDTERDGYRTNFHPALLQSLSGMEDPGRHSCWWILPKYGGGWLFWFVLCCFVLFCLVYFVFHKVHCLFLFSPLVTARMWLIDNLLWIYHALFNILKWVHLCTVQNNRKRGEHCELQCLRIYKRIESITRAY